jgi:hypothetical protein
MSKPPPRNILNMLLDPTKPLLDRALRPRLNLPLLDHDLRPGDEERAV